MDFQIPETETFSEFLKSKQIFEFVGLVISFFVILSIMGVTSQRCSKSFASLFRSYISLTFVFYLLFIIFFGSNQIDYSLQVGFINIGPMFLLFYLIFISGFLSEEKEVEEMDADLQEIDYTVININYH